MPDGSELPSATIFSDIICRALKMSMPQLNSAHTNEYPCIEADRTRLTLVAPFTAVSMGNVTSLSPSSAAIPLASVITTTVGAVRSGNTSIFMFLDEYIPAPIINAAPSRIISLFFSENLMMLLINSIISCPPAS